MGSEFLRVLDSKQQCSIWKRLKKEGAIVFIVNMGGSEKLKCRFSIIVNLLHFSREI